MKKIALLAGILITLAGCNSYNKTENQSEVREETVVTETGRRSTLEIGCYEYQSNGNHIKMEITGIADSVMGDFNIAYAEKDASQGKFVGTLNDDKLIGTYTFNSEGTESSREIAFLVKGGQLIEGYGELNEEGTKYMDVKTIEYSSTMPLTKVDCDQ